MAARRARVAPIDNEARDYADCTPAALQQLKEKGFFFQQRFEGQPEWHTRDLASRYVASLKALGHEVYLFATKTGGAAVWSRWTKEAEEAAQHSKPSPWPFAVGDVVQLKSGGGSMVVSELLCRGHIRCLYWCDAADRDVGHIRGDDFPPGLLRLAPPEEEIPF